jgi:conjugative transfer signal peptidase TraF
VPSKEVKNKYVIFCPDYRPAFRMAKNRGYIGSGFCEGGTGLMMKKVVATSGDIISIGKAGVTVNNEPLPFSTPKNKDANNRELKAKHLNHYQLKEGELLTMTDQDEWSFDGRYYGLIYKSQIKGSIVREL